MDQENINKLTDEELVKITLGDQDYFLYLIQRYRMKIGNYIRRITNVGDEDAEDLLQDIFLKVYLNLNDFDPDLKFSSWIYSIARHEAISRYRKIRARAEGYSVPLDDELLNRLISAVDIQKVADSRMLSSGLNQVLGELKQKFRDILVLKYVEEKSYQEISDIIKKPVGTVGSMLNKAKSDFIKAFKKLKIKL